MESHHTKSPEETIALATSFASTLCRNDIVALVGELGSGKTQFVKGVCSYFKVHNLVSSPTFVMLHRYDGIDNRGEELLIYHFDLYKIKTMTEVLELGYEEFFQGNGICLIEWAEMLGDMMPQNHIDIRLSIGSKETDRTIEIVRLPATRKTSVDIGADFAKEHLTSEHPRH
jgi:tRNA threonylcarbamoyladenosine biosynthesis protein TsaE